MSDAVFRKRGYEAIATGVCQCDSYAAGISSALAPRQRRSRL